MTQILSDMRRSTAMALMLLGTVTISFGGLLIRAVESADVWQIAFYRSIALFGVIAILLLFRYGKAMPRQVTQVGRPGIWAGICMAGATICFLQSITTTTVANTLFMLGAVPFITAAAARIVLGERLSPSTGAAMIVATAGIVVMVVGGIGTGSVFGNVMGLMTACFFSGYAILVRRHRALDMLPLLLVSSVIVAALAFVMRWDDLGVPLRDVLICFVIGGILSGGANGLFIHCAKQLEAAELTLFTLLEIALGPFWVWVFIQETPSASTLVGGLIVICTVLVRALVELGRAKRVAT